MDDIEAPVDVEKLRRRLSEEAGEGRMLSTVELLRLEPRLVDSLRRKPVRSASGIVPVAVMSSPAQCPHGRCVPCPGGPGSHYDSPQSYTGYEPAAARARRLEYRPYAQTESRLEQLSSCGHSIGKVELIVMGGTFTAREHGYQKWFVGECFRAMNDAGRKDVTGGRQVENMDENAGDLHKLHVENEGAAARCVAMTLETRPDQCSYPEIDGMLELGATKVELGVQCLDDEILKAMNRGHGVAEVRDATARLRDAGFKVGYHLMPGLPGSGPKDDVESARRVFREPEFRPDYLKIYPTLVVESSRLAEIWRRGEYAPMDTGQATQVVAEIKMLLPPWVRLSRVQRDIPLAHILAGVDRANLRELAQKEVARRGGRCRCIRCREPGRRPEVAATLEPEDLRLNVIEYLAAGSREHFICRESAEHDMLVAFLRLRFPDTPHRPELRDAAVVRELHVYGNALPVGGRPRDVDWQHRGLGGALLARAEEVSADAGYERIAVLSGAGVRPYYRRLGYRRDGPYMVREI